MASCFAAAQAAPLPGVEAVVLVGGLGTRMRPLTLSAPKPMLPLAGLPLLTHLLGRIRAAGVTRVVLGTSYRAEVFATHFGDGSLSPEDLAGGLTGAVVQDPVQDKVIWQEYLEAVVRERDGWGALYRACRAL